MSQPRRYVEVAVNGPLKRTFTYHLTDPRLELTPGQRVIVPFGRARKLGFYLGDCEKPAGLKTKAVGDIPDAGSFFPTDLFELCRWISDYYFANPADCFSAALPGKFKAYRGIRYHWNKQVPDAQLDGVQDMYEAGKSLTNEKVKALRWSGKGLFRRLLDDGVILEKTGPGALSPRMQVRGYRATESDKWETFFARRAFQPQPFTGELSRANLREAGWTDHYLRLAVKHGLIEAVCLEKGIMSFVAPRDDVDKLSLTSEQSRSVDSVSSELHTGFRVFLLHGVTGSGKTLVYCHLARRVLASERSVLVLTPEIALSGITLAYLRGFFGTQVTALHSAMTERERLDSWQGIRSGKYRIVVGPRSALFAPMKNPGLIIVDEEHDGSYKQDDPAPRFHGRDAAIMRAKINRIPILLGSASPSVESYHNAKTGRYRLLTLTDRPGAAKLPAVDIVDMRSQKIGGEHTFLSYPLKKRLQRCLGDGDQAILFLNRRGYSPQLKCGDCGHHPTCPSCKVALTYHKVGQKLSCHYCGHLRLDYHQCERCKGTKPVFLGAGTQKIEDQIPRLVDQARTIRFDSDTASGRRRAHRILRAFADREYNLLLGTQMVTKGLDMKGVSLVGVLSADHGLDMPDFRASEKTFAQLLQVAGRSGRSDRTGHVTIQTFRPDDPVIADAACQDYTAFFDREILSRKEVRFPPFRRLANLTLSGTDDRKVLRASEKLRDLLRNACTGSNSEVQIMGPAPCPLHYLRNKYRYRLLVKAVQMVGFARLLAEMEAHQPGFGLPSTVKIEVDIDPVDMM